MPHYNLPYFADPVSLPGKLPSREDIESDRHLLSRSTGMKVASVGEHFVVKYGTNVDLEGENMLFVQQTTLVPVPRTYALFECSNGDNRPPTRYIGNPLSAEWPFQHRS
jgi:hypothetical protein